MLRFTIGLCLATAALASLGFAHAQPTDDSLRIYAVDIWQDPPQSWGPGRGVLLASAGAEEKPRAPRVRQAFLLDIKIIVMTLFSRRAYTNAV